jgi:hypothetical protein
MFVQFSKCSDNVYFHRTTKGIQSRWSIQLGHVRRPKNSTARDTDLDRADLPLDVDNDIGILVFRHFATIVRLVVAGMHAQRVVDKVEVSRELYRGTLNLHTFND